MGKIDKVEVMRATIQHHWSCLPGLYHIKTGLLDIIKRNVGWKNDQDNQKVAEEISILVSFALMNYEKEGE
jgi:hypothetical protein